MVENLVFGGVSFAANFSPTPRALPSAMVARHIQKICAASLPNSQIFNHFRYIEELIKIFSDGLRKAVRDRKIPPFCIH